MLFVTFSFFLLCNPDNGIKDKENRKGVTKIHLAEGKNQKNGKKGGTFTLRLEGRKGKEK